MSQKAELRVVRFRTRRLAGSMIEVLVSISIMVFLLALLVPGLNSARERARRVMCSNNLHQWGCALQFYRDEHDDYLPKEGYDGKSGSAQPGAWYNELPPYLDLPPYRDFAGVGEAISELPNIHLWICPAKNLTGSYKSDSGMNQYHYGMNRVLDGLGTVERPSADTPGFLDQTKPLQGRQFASRPRTVFLFDISPNSPGGTPRKVATKYQRTWDGGRAGKFHGDYANVLYLDGAVGHCTTDQLVTDRDFEHGDIIWNNPNLYWGYLPP